MTTKTLCPVMARERDALLHNVVAEVKENAASVLKKCGHCETTASEGAPLKKCGGCHMQAYCTRACQANDWQSHKPHCLLPANLKVPGTAQSDINMYRLVQHWSDIFCPIWGNAVDCVTDLLPLKPGFSVATHGLILVLKLDTSITNPGIEHVFEAFESAELAVTSLKEMCSLNAGIQYTLDVCRAAVQMDPANIAMAHVFISMDGHATALTRHRVVQGQQRGQVNRLCFSLRNDIDAWSNILNETMKEVKTLMSK